MVIRAPARLESERMRAIAAGLSDVGKQRLHNEDRFILLPEFNVFVVADGMSVLRPLSMMWPWRTTCRACFNESAKPILWTMLSSRSSNDCTRFSPVTPGWRTASL